MGTAKGSARRRSLVALTLLAFAALAAPPVSAFPPEEFGPDTFEYSFVGFTCDGFDILIEGTGTQRVTAYFDAAGNVTRIAVYGRFPADVLTNLTTGRSVVNRGEFQEQIVGDPETGTFTKTVTGHRNFVNDPGLGATVREVGRITYLDAEQTLVGVEAGHHDLAFDEQYQPVFCAVLS